MSLRDLLNVVRPPTQPRQVPTAAEIHAVEQDLGLSFPPDYLAMCAAYGRGLFSSTCTGVGLLLPNAHYRFNLETSQIRLAPERHRVAPPFRAFPTRPGLLPWAYDEGDAEVYWFVDERSPEQWPVVTRIAERYDEAAFEWFDLSATAFLAQAFSHQIAVSLWEPLRFGYDEDAAEALRQERVLFELR